MSKQVELCLTHEEMGELAEALAEIERRKGPMIEALDRYNEVADTLISDLEDAHREVEEACEDFDSVFAEAGRRLRKAMEEANVDDPTAIEAMTEEDRRVQYRDYCKANPLAEQFLAALDSCRGAQVDELPGSLYYSIDPLDVKVQVPPKDVEAMLAMTELRRAESSLKATAKTLNKNRLEIIRALIRDED